MKYSAHIANRPGHQDVRLKLGDKEQTLVIPAKDRGGSGITGGELLFLALATCYCNDLYREATKLGIKIEGVEIEVEGEFEGPGMPATNILYRARVSADATAEEIRALLIHTDAIAEIHKTVRVGTPIKLQPVL